MIQQLNIQDPPAFRQPFGGGDVFWTGIRCAAWMIVNGDNALGITQDRTLENFSGTYHCRVQRSHAADIQVDGLSVRPEVDDGEHFTVVFLQLTGHGLQNIIRIIDRLIAVQRGLLHQTDIDNPDLIFLLLRQESSPPRCGSGAPHRPEADAPSSGVPPYS